MMKCKCGENLSPMCGACEEQAFEEQMERMRKEEAAKSETRMPTYWVAGSAGGRSAEDMDAQLSAKLPCGHPAACGEPCGWCAEVAALKERLEQAGDSMPEAE